MFNLFKRKKQQTKPEISFELCNSFSKIPTKATPNDLGYDLVVTGVKLKYNEANEPILIYSTGIKSHIPEGYAAIIVPRSSVFKKRLILANSLGVIDAGYRDEWHIIFKVTSKLSSEEITMLATGAIPKEVGFYNIGDRAAQVIFVKEEQVILKAVTQISAEGNRGGGLGHTDLKDKQMKIQFNN